MIEKKQTLPFLMIFLPAGAVLFIQGYLGSFTRLLADDYCSAYYARHLGLLRSIWYWRLNWSGRYAAFGADWLMEKIGMSALSVIPALSLLVWAVFTVLALHLSLRRVLPPGTSLWTALSLGTLFPCIVLSLSPNVPQSLYWWNGMRSYTLPLILLTIYAVLFQLGVEKLESRKGMVVGSLLSFLFMFANGGLGETYVAFQLALMASLVTLEWLIHRDSMSSRFLFLLAGLVGSVVALVAVISAPGNAIRESSFPPHPDIATLLRISWAGYLDFVIDIVRTPGKITGMLGALLAVFWLGSHSEHRLTGSRWLAPALFFVAFLLSFACFVPGVYGTSEPPPTRAFVIPVFILVACLLCAGFLTGGWFARPRYLSRLVGSAVLIAAVLFITYSALIASQSLYDSRNVYVEFAQKWDATDALISQAKASGQESVQIPAMDNWAGLERPTPRKKYWPNVCFSLYYGIQVYGPPYSDQ